MELQHLELRRLSNGESITYLNDFMGVISYYPSIKALAEPVVTPFANAIAVAVKSSTKVNTSGYTDDRKHANLLRSNGFLHFRGIVESALQSVDRAESAASALVVGAIRVHGWKMQGQSPDKFTASLNALFGALDTPEMKAALATLHADKALANLVTLNTQFEQVDKLRNSVLAEQTDPSTTAALREAQVWYNKTVTVIEGLMLTSNEPKIAEMVDRLNVITEAKLQTIRSRATRSENSKKDSDQPNISNSEDEL